MSNFDDSGTVVKTPSTRTHDLYYAISISSVETVKELLDAGADVNSRTSNDLTPLHQACGCFLSSEVSLNGPEFDNKVKSKSKHIFNENIIKLLLERGADIEAKAGRDMETPFLGACKGSLAVVKLLLKFGANMHELDEWDQSALHMAAYGNKLDIVNFLLLKGFDINIKDEDGDTPLSSNIRYQNKPCLATMEFLLDNGADISFKDEEDMTPIESASESHNIEVLDCLLEFKANQGFPRDERGAYSYADIISLGSSEQAFKHVAAFITAREDNIFRYIGKVSREYAGLRESLKSLKPWTDKCKCEVSRMKKERICETKNVTYLNFLTEHLLRVTMFARSGDILQELESCDYKKNFPSYVFLFESRIKRIKKLRTFLDMAEDFLKKYSETNLPSVVLREIFQYLSVSDIRNFGRALSQYY